MSDKQAPSQIIDLFEAMKGSQYDISRSPNERSVPAPKFEMCRSCGMNGPSCESIVSSPARCCSNCTHTPRREISFGEERAAVVKYLRERAPGFLHSYAININCLANEIEQGEHVK